jgi:hypothetical protein
MTPVALNILHDVIERSGIGKQGLVGPEGVEPTARWLREAGQYAPIPFQ